MAKKKKERLPSSARSQAEEGLRLLSTLLGMSPQELQANPKRLYEVLEKLLVEFQDILVQLGSQDPPQRPEIQARLETLQKSLEAQGIHLELDKLPESYLTSAQQNLKTISANLEELATQLERLSTEAYPEISLTFLSKLGDLFTNQEAEQARLKEQQEASRRQAAQAAVERATKNFKLPSLRFDDLLSEVDRTDEEEGA